MKRPDVKTLADDIGEQGADNESRREVQNGGKCVVYVIRKPGRVRAIAGLKHQREAEHDKNNDADSEAHAHRLARLGPPIILTQDIGGEKDSGIKNNAQGGLNSKNNGQLRALQIRENDGGCDCDLQTGLTEKSIQGYRCRQVEQQCGQPEQLLVVCKKLYYRFRKHGRGSGGWGRIDEAFEVKIGIAEGQVNGSHTFEIVRDVEFPGNAHAAVHLNGFARDLDACRTNLVL